MLYTIIRQVSPQTEDNALKLEGRFQIGSKSVLMYPRGLNWVHIILVVRRGGVSAADLAAISVALVRSVLEYCVWFSITPFPPMPSEIERLQMRALRIVNPPSSYKEALQGA